MAAKYISSQLIKNLQRNATSAPASSAGQAIGTVGTIAVEYVERTTSWVRPQGFPSESLKREFVTVVEENLDTLNPRTVRVAMKYNLIVIVLFYCLNTDRVNRESEHASDSDNNQHYTIYEFDAKGKDPIATRHITIKK